MNAGYSLLGERADVGYKKYIAIPVWYFFYSFSIFQDERLTAGRLYRDLNRLLRTLEDAHASGSGYANQTDQDFFDEVKVGGN